MRRSGASTSGPSGWDRPQLDEIAGLRASFDRVAAALRALDRDPASVAEEIEAARVSARDADIQVSKLREQQRERERAKHDLEESLASSTWPRVSPHTWDSSRRGLPP